MQTAYPNIVEDERNSLQKLRGMHVDVLLAAHGFWFDLGGKAARQKTGAPNPFIDPGELSRHNEREECHWNHNQQELHNNIGKTHSILL
jgi:metallo-beta-lactamase class B